MTAELFVQIVYGSIVIGMLGIVIYGGRSIHTLVNSQLDEIKLELKEARQEVRVLQEQRAVKEAEKKEEES